MTNILPNWAAKYFIDSLLRKKEVLSHIAERPKFEHGMAPDLPRNVPLLPAREAAKPQRIVLVTGWRSTKLQRMLAAWEEWGFEPSAVVVEKGVSVPAHRRILKIVGDRGISGLLQRLARGAEPQAGSVASKEHQPESESVLDYCARRGIRTIVVETLASAAGVQAVAALDPDLLIHAGAGIIRQPLLDASRLGMVNAHMGMLPFYRGMNVTEWAAFNGDPIGCSVHLIDKGIDTGDIVLVRPVAADGADDIAALRATVDAAQIELLGEVVRYIAMTGELPPRHSQHAGDGRQFFIMHPELAKQLQLELASHTRSRQEILSQGSACRVFIVPQAPG
jgi:folate-dependent phosphoribosylglycinamide formyltransferase PurN